MMREATGARLTSDAALLLWYGIGLLDCHERGHAAPAAPSRSVTIALSQTGQA